MSHEHSERLQNISSQLLNEYNDVELVAALLQELVEANDEVEVQLTFEKPLARKGRQNSKGPRRGGKPSNKRSNNKHDNKNRRGKGKFNNKKQRNDKKDHKKPIKGRTFADLQK